MDEQGGQAEEARVMEMLGEWREEDALKEEPINIDELLQTSAGQIRAANLSLQSQAPSLPQGLLMNHSAAQDYDMAQKVPTFSSANRPSVLDLSTTAIKSDYGDSARMGMNGHSPHHQRAPSPHHQQPSPHSPHHQQPSPHSPHHQQPSPHSPHQRSPYMSNQPVFNYSNSGQAEQQSPLSPHAPQQMHSPVSPHQRSVSPHNHHSEGSNQGPLSPHMARQMSPHPQMNAIPPPMSPHSPYRSVSPHSEHNLVIVSPVSPHAMTNHSGGASPMHPGMQQHSGDMSPHHMSQHPGAVSPVGRQFSPTPGASTVFGRYAGSPVSMHSGNSSDTDSYYGAYSPAQIAEMRKRGIHIDKDTDMYKAKRERNNVAVRKSREKKKQREQETEKRVKDLCDENGALQNKLDIALKEMTLLKNLYKNIGVQLPTDIRDKLENELSKFK